MLFRSAVSPETELNSRDSALTFEGDDVIIRPISQVSTMPAPIVRTSTVETMLPPSPTNPRAKPLRRGSAFILLTSKPSEFSPSSARLNLVMSPKKGRRCRTHLKPCPFGNGADCVPRWQRPKSGNRGTRPAVSASDDALAAKPRSDHRRTRSRRRTERRLWLRA